MTQIKYKIDGVMSKQVFVKQSLRNVNRALEFQATMADMETDMEEMSEKEQIKAAINSNEKMVKYIAELLNLDDEQKDKLFDLTPEEVANHMTYLTRRIMGDSDKQIKEDEEKNDEGLTE